MKKFKLSTAEKGLIRSALVVVLIQVIIILVFIRLWNTSQPIDIAETKRAEIVVDDTYYDVGIGKHASSYLFIIAGGTEYRIGGGAGGLFSGEPSPNKLYKTISKGDKLSLVYCERTWLFYGKVNVVYDARTETETYRSFEEYSRIQTSVPTFVIVFFSIIELIFAVGVFIYVWFVWLDFNVVKGFYRKLKKHLTKKKKI